MIKTTQTWSPQLTDKNPDLIELNVNELSLTSQGQGPTSGNAVLALLIPTTPMILAIARWRDKFRV